MNRPNREKVKAERDTVINKFVSPRVQTAHVSTGRLSMVCSTYLDARIRSAVFDQLK